MSFEVTVWDENHCVTTTDLVDATEVYEGDNFLCFDKDNSTVAMFPVDVIYKVMLHVEPVLATPEVVPETTVIPAKKKRNMSPEGLEKIRAAQKKRWDAKRAGQETV